MNRICELEDQADYIDNIIKRKEKEKQSLEAEISDIDYAIEELELEKENIIEEYSKIQEAFEPSLSNQERNEGGL